jgi:hypothetical protein
MFVVFYILEFSVEKKNASSLTISISLILSSTVIRTLQFNPKSSKDVRK